MITHIAKTTMPYYIIISYIIDSNTYQHKTAKEAVA